MEAVVKELLIAHGADRMAHPGGTLLAHLDRVGAALREWGARPALQAAGETHAFYGTDGFPQPLLPLDRRGQLREIIGAEAEAVVYFYASCDRGATYPTLDAPEVTFRDRFAGETFHPTHQQLSDFAELTAANELDIIRVSADFRDKHGAAILRLLNRLDRWLSPSARASLATT